MKLAIKTDNRFRVEDIERDDKSPDWIEKYKQANPGKLPLLPSFLKPVVNGYKMGEPISKDIKVIPVSGQQWQLLTTYERTQLLELVEWLGGNAEDYVRSFEIMYPFSPSFSNRRSS